MNIRAILKKNSFIRSLHAHVLWLWNSFLTFVARLRIRLFNPEQYKMLKQMKEEVRKLYPLNLNLTSPLRFFTGKNVLGYPSMTFLLKDGQPIGWEEGRVKLEDAELLLMQLKTDREINFPA